MKAVETEYNKKKPMVLPIDEEDAQAEQEAEDAYVYQQEAAYTKEPEPEEKVLEEQPETVFDDEETGEEEAFSNAVQEPEEEQELSCEEEESEADSEPEVSSEPEVVSGSSKKTKLSVHSFTRPKLRRILRRKCPGWQRSMDTARKLRRPRHRCWRIYVI